MQEEQAALSPPASGAERPDGSDSGPSDSARWGLVAISSDERHGGNVFQGTWSKKLIFEIHSWKIWSCFTFIRSNIKPLKMPWYLLSNV